MEWEFEGGEEFGIGRVFVFQVLKGRMGTHGYAWVEGRCFLHFVPFLRVSRLRVWFLSAFPATLHSDEMKLIARRYTKANSVKDIHNQFDFAEF